MTISRKLELAFAVFSLVLIISAGALGSWMGEEIILNNINQSRLQGTVNLLASIGQTMNSYQRDILSLANSTTLQNEKSATQDIRSEISNYQRHSGYLSVAFFDMNRQSVALVGNDNIITASDLEKVWDSILFGRTSVGEQIRFDEKSQTPVMYFSAPVKNPVGKPIGMVVIASNLNRINVQIDNFSRAAGEFVSLITTNKDIIASSDPLYKEKILRTKMDGIKAVSEAISGKTGVVEEYFKPHNETEIIVFAQEKGFEDFVGNKWSLIMMMDKDKVFAPVIAFRNRIIGFGSIIFILAMLLGFLISKGIVSSLIKIMTVVENVSKGDIEQRVEIKSKDEIGFLARVFNQMLDSIRDSKRQLEKNNRDIKERNEDLNKTNESLSGARRAMMNLLEDAKILEGKLEEEKENVERKVVERTRELKEERAKLLASIESLSFGFVIADVNDNILVKNPALSEILELTEEPVNIHDLVNSLKGVSSGLDVLTHSCRECIDLKKVVELKEVPHGKKYLRVFCTPILMKEDVQETTIGYVMIVEDITEAKVMERSRDEFFAVASHELRTPLTAIRGNADMILSMYADKIIDNDMKEMLQDINSSSVRLIEVVNDFLEVSRLEQGKAELKKENFDMLEVVGRVVRDMKTIVEGKGLSLTYTPPTNSVPLVYADKNKSEQILLNLLGNATKFTKEGGIILEVVSDAHFVTIRVTDTGDGISEHNQTLLFRKFQQAGEDMLARDVTQSTGLGLYISKLIIASMGGTIGLEKSELGKGSTFFFTLPTEDIVPTKGKV